MTEAGPLELLLRVLEKWRYTRGFVFYLLLFVDSWKPSFPYYRFPEIDQDYIARNPLCQQVPKQMLIHSAL